MDYDPPAHYQGEVLAVDSGARAEPTAACYRRTNVDLAKCRKQRTMVLHQYDRQMKAWTTVAGTNCFPGAEASVRA